MQLRFHKLETIKKGKLRKQQKPNKQTKNPNKVLFKINAAKVLDSQ